MQTGVIYSGKLGNKINIIRSYFKLQPTTGYIMRRKVVNLNNIKFNKWCSDLISYSFEIPNYSYRRLLGNIRFTLLQIIHATS